MALVSNTGDEDFITTSALSTPTGKLLTLNKVYQSVDGSHVEAFSFSRVFKRLKDGRTCEATQIQVISVQTPPKNTGKTDLTISKKKQTKFWKDPPPDKKDIVNTKPQNLGIKGDQKKKSSAPYLFKMITKKTITFGFLIALIATLLCLHDNDCKPVWNMEKLSSDLSKNLFGQNEVIAKVISILTMCNQSNGLYTMVFTGGVGVGKTYTSSIVGEHFPGTMSSLIVNLSSGSDISQVVPSSFSNCGCHLLRVDDLTINDLDKVVNLVLAVKNKMKNDKVILLLIFNVQKYEEKREIFNRFTDSSISVFHIPFRDLDERNVEKCFRVEIDRQRAQVSESELAKLVKMKMKFVDTVNGPVGCKGVSEEVSSFQQK